MINLLQTIRDFLSLQLVLLTAFTEKFPDCKDYKFLLDFPKNGNFLIEGTTWKFIKHGAGLLFISETDGTEIDVRRAIDLTEAFDLNRLEQYLESVGISVDSLEENLNDEIEKGNIVLIDKSYKLLELDAQSRCPIQTSN